MSMDFRNFLIFRIEEVEGKEEKRLYAVFSEKQKRHIGDTTEKQK